MTDSLSLPRRYKGGEVQWEATYVSRIRAKMPEIEMVHVGIGGATSVDLLAQHKYYETLKPDITVLQCGIVDCAPRAFTQFEIELIGRLRLSKISMKFTKLLRKYRGLTYVSIHQFEKCILDFKRKTDGSKLIAIGILPGCEAYENVAPGISTNIMNYNNVLRKCTEYIDVSDIDGQCITEDYHHLNEFGHSFIYEKLWPVLESFLSRSR